MEQTSAIFDSYRSELLRVYADECHDTESFDSVGGDFERHVQSRMAAGQTGSELYQTIWMKTATAGDASGAFREFLAGGLNCADKAVEKRARSHAAIIANTQNTESFHDAWHGFMDGYMKLMDQIYNLISSKMMEVAELRSSRWHIDPEISKQFSGAANKVSTFASTGFRASIEKLAQFQAPDHFYAIIVAQRSQLQNLHTNSAKLSSALDSSAGAKPGPFLTDIAKFNEAWRAIRNPIKWANSIYTGMQDFRKFLNPDFRVQIDTNQIPPNADTAPVTIIQIIDRVLLLAAKHGMQLSIHWSSRKNLFIIDSVSKGYQLQFDKELIKLVYDSGGTLEAPEMNIVQKFLYEKFGGDPVRSSIVIPYFTGAAPTSEGAPSGQGGPTLSSADNSSANGMPALAQMANIDDIAPDAALSPVTNENTQGFGIYTMQIPVAAPAYYSQEPCFRIIP